MLQTIQATTTTGRRVRRVSQPSWAAPLFTRDRYRYKVLYGGRGSGKSWAVGTALAVMASQRPLRVVVCRDKKLSLDQSSKKVIEDQIQRLGLPGFKITERYISHTNGSYFFFRGLSAVQEREIMGWESCDIAWIDQAEMMSATAWEILKPTLRKDHSEIWLTFNPRYRYDPAYINFVARPRSRAFVRKVNYEENPWFKQSPMEETRADDDRDDPERYKHIWLGEPDDAGAARKVLPYALAALCRDAWKPEYATIGVPHAGLDVADTGSANNAHARRRGPALYALDLWRGQTLGITARRADGTNVGEGVARMYYDAGGVGAGIRSHYYDMPPRPYGLRGVNFGGKTEGAELEYTPGVTNEQFFSRRNAQMGWGMRLRANATQRLIDGDPVVRPDQCLFINPAIKDVEKIMTQLSQPEWSEDTSGRMVVDKQPEDSPSPDAYDGAVLSFASDSEDYGLTKPR